MTKINFHEKTSQELVVIIDDAVRALKSRSYVEGFEAGREFERKPFVSPKEEAQEMRDRIVEQSKRDIEELKHTDDVYKVYRDKANVARMWREGSTYGGCRVGFIVNKEKRTVVALMRGINSGELYSKGIAKCAPNDCFNVHIGKAIALRRALGIEVPAEYLNAPQPTEVRVGDVVYDEYYDMQGTVYAINPERRTYGVDNGCYFGKEKGWLTYIDPLDYERRIKQNRVTVIDDSRDEVSG